MQVPCVDSRSKRPLSSACICVDSKGDLKRYKCVKRHVSLLTRPLLLFFEKQKRDTHILHVLSAKAIWKYLLKRETNVFKRETNSVLKRETHLLERARQV